MSDPENFIARWSRRKQAAQEEAAQAEAKAPADADAPAQPKAAGDTASKREAGAPAPPTFDIESLPPIESITAESDIRPFLAPGVPPELTRAALRRAWSADPKIRDFVGLADYDWDFNAPGAITGFGALQMSDDVRREMLRMVGRSLATAAGDEAMPALSHSQPEQPLIEASRESAAIAAVPEPARETADGEPKDQSMTNKNKLYNSPSDLRREPNIALRDGSKLPDDDDHSDHSVVKRPHGSALPR
jgi:hypothetical protein